MLVLHSTVAYFSEIFFHKKFQGPTLSGSNGHHAGFIGARWGGL
jgi:hypothetical protein